MENEINKKKLIKIKANNMLKNFRELQMTLHEYD